VRAEPAAVTEATAATGPLVKGPRWLLPAGALLLAAVLAAWLADLVTHLSYMAAMRDLVVYRDGGLIVRHVSPAYDPPPRLAAVRLDRPERRPVHLSPVRRGDLLRRLGAVLDGDALGDDPGQPGRPRPVAVAGVRRARLPGPARGQARRDARRLRARAGHRTRPADPRPRPGQPAAHAARRGGPAHRRRACAGRPHPLVARTRHRDRGGREADPADLHPVPAAHPQVPAGRRGRRRVRGHGGARLRDPAA